MNKLLLISLLIAFRSAQHLSAQPKIDTTFQSGLIFGDHNILVGWHAGWNIVEGSYNIIFKENYKSCAARSFEFVVDSNLVFNGQKFFPERKPLFRFLQQAQDSMRKYPILQTDTAYRRWLNVQIMTKLQGLNFPTMHNSLIELERDRMPYFIPGIQIDLGFWQPSTEIPGTYLPKTPFSIRQSNGGEMIIVVWESFLEVNERGKIVMEKFPTAFWLGKMTADKM